MKTTWTVSEEKPRAILTISDDGWATIAADATPDELRSAIAKIVTAYHRDAARWRKVAPHLYVARKKFDSGETQLRVQFSEIVEVWSPEGNANRSVEEIIDALRP